MLALAGPTAHGAQMFPDVPTVAEAALPDYEFQAWFGMFASVAPPRAVVEQIAARWLASSACRWRETDGESGRAGALQHA